MNPITELGISSKAAQLIDEIVRRKNPAAGTTTARDDAGDVSKINCGFGPALTAEDEHRLKLLRGEMHADDTSPKMRAQLARASLRARGLDLFAPPRDGK